MANKTKKKRRLSLRVRITLLFLIASFFAAIATLILSQRHLIRMAINSSSDVANAALIGAVDIIWTKDPELSLYNDRDEAEVIHRMFRDICKNTGLRYLYFYNVEDDGLIRYYVCAANTDEDDARFNKEIGFRGTMERDLYDAEIEALKGDDDTYQQFISNDFGFVCTWVTPLLSRKGEVRGLLGADYDFTIIAKRVGDNLVFLGIAGLIAFNSFFLISVLLVGREVVLPIKELSKRMSIFTVQKKVEPSTRKTFFEDEITDIEGSFDAMVTEIERHIKKISEFTMEKVQAQTQVSVARNIQCGIVPEFTDLKEECYDIYCLSKPARAVGGDFYDVFETGKDKVCFIIGDVSGKGISAALFMMMVKSAIREKIRAGKDPDIALNEANDDICRSNPENMFATVFAAVLDLDTGMLTYANAGHNRPVFIGADVREIYVDPAMAIGIFEGTDIRKNSIILGDGEGMFVYTDGITEAIDSNNEQYGTEKLLAAIKGAVSASGSPSSEEISDAVRKSVNEFTAGLEQFDDLTCVALRYHKRKTKIKALLPDLSELSVIKSEIFGVIKDEEKAKDVMFCCEEIFVNIIMHSGADDIKFSFEETDVCARAVFSDNGKRFDPLLAKDEKKDFEDLDMGGMGLSLVKEKCKEMHYKRDGEYNILTIGFDI